MHLIEQILKKNLLSLKKNETNSECKPCRSYATLEHIQIINSKCIPRNKQTIYTHTHTYLSNFVTKHEKHLRNIGSCIFTIQIQRDNEFRIQRCDLIQLKKMGSTVKRREKLLIFCVLATQFSLCVYKWQDFDIEKSVSVVFDHFFFNNDTIFVRCITHSATNYSFFIFQKEKSEKQFIFSVSKFVGILFFWQEQLCFNYNYY